MFDVWPLPTYICPVRPQRHSRGGGPAPKAATRVAASTPPPKHLDVFKGAPLRLPKPHSDQFPVRVCSCPLCIWTVCECEPQQTPIP